MPLILKSVVLVLSRLCTYCHRAWPPCVRVSILSRELCLRLWEYLLISLEPLEALSLPVLASEFPADLFALLYDKNCKYLDCVFYRNTEGANGAFFLNVATNSLSMDLTRVPEECYIIVLAAAVYTLGLSLTGRYTRAVPLFSKLA